MAKRWKVNEGTQVDVGGKIRVGGDEFSATDDELDEFGSRPYVTEVRTSAPKADDKAQTAPSPRSTQAENKAQAAPTPRKASDSK